MRSSTGTYYKQRMQAKEIQIQKHKTNLQQIKALPNQIHHDYPLISHSPSTKFQLISSYYPSRMSLKSRSGSRPRKNSKNKLFQKAHQTIQGQTYLKNIKIEYSLSSGQATLATPLRKKSLSSLSVFKELDVKINGGISDEQSQLSKLFMQLDCEGAFSSVGLSSIKQDGYQTSSQIQVSENFLKDIYSK